MCQLFGRGQSGANGSTSHPSQVSGSASYHRTLIVLALENLIHFLYISLQNVQKPEQNRGP